MRHRLAFAVAILLVGSLQSHAQQGPEDTVAGLRVAQERHAGGFRRHLANGCIVVSLPGQPRVIRCPKPRHHHRSYHRSRPASPSNGTASPDAADSSVIVPDATSAQPEPSLSIVGSGNHAALHANTASGLVAARLFVGPHGDFPPRRYGAYGIVAFPQRAAASTRARHEAACRAYVTSLPPSGEMTQPIAEQMVTVWPVRNPDEVAAKEHSGSDALCKAAVDDYELAAGQDALRNAERATGRPLDGLGPYLLAWSPSTTVGRPDALVLIADLSGADTFAHFSSYMRRWRSEIENNPDLWKDGWQPDGLATVIQHWVDRWGPSILTLGGSGG